MTTKMAPLILYGLGLAAGMKQGGWRSDLGVPPPVPAPKPGAAPAPTPNSGVNLRGILFVLYHSMYKILC